MSAQAPAIKYHSMGGLNNRELLLLDLQAGKQPKMRLMADLLLVWASLLAFV